MLPTSFLLFVIQPYQVKSILIWFATLLSNDLHANVLKEKVNLYELFGEFEKAELYNRKSTKKSTDLYFKSANKQAYFFGKGGQLCRWVFFSLRSGIIIIKRSILHSYLFIWS